MVDYRYRSESTLRIDLTYGRSTTGPWTLIATTTANVVSYQNTGLVAGTAYYYRVRATNAGGDSANTSVMLTTK